MFRGLVLSLGFRARRRWLVLVIFFILLLMVGLWLFSHDAERRYSTLLSEVVYDRHLVPLSIKENSKGHYVDELLVVPTDFARLLIAKEDRFFYYHLGINPFSSVRALFNYVTEGKPGGSSTITQQLAKNILGTESDRTLLNKIIESMYAVGMEVFMSKEEILLMYANTVYLGNQVQGFGTASRAYFDKDFSDTTENERLSLLATLSFPSTRNPWASDNTTYAEALHSRLAPDGIFLPPVVTDAYAFQTDSYFELRTAGVTCPETCRTTIDNEVTGTIRKILARTVDEGRVRNIRNGAVVVIDAKTSEVISVVGSVNPKSQADGNQINMAVQPRPIGSTIKPFIYAKGFELGLRPYTLVEDREYKYPIATGFSLYPKNYDGLYRGEVTLHESLSNSYNVPTVKTLEYIGLDNFYGFLNDQLRFEPIQDYDSYQYGIALGGLEMDLLTLTHYFTVFPTLGYLSPLKMVNGSQENFDLPPQSQITDKQLVFDREYVELTHAILRDRFAGVNQFGLAGNLNLTASGYGVKTGTSRDYHDSWVVGYTSDFVVGVWLGNSENEALDQVSGSTGAGAVWHDVMEYLLSTSYNTNTEIEFKYLTKEPIGRSDEWTIRGDTIADHRTLLKDDQLILSVHSGDTFALQADTSIPLRARVEVEWTIDGERLGVANELNFQPEETGQYEVTAFHAPSGDREIITIQVVNQE